MKIRFIRDVELDVMPPPEKEYLTYGCPVSTDFEGGQFEEVRIVTPEIGGMHVVTFKDGGTASISSDDFEVVSEPERKRK